MTWTVSSPEFEYQSLIPDPAWTLYAEILAEGIESLVYGYNVSHQVTCQPPFGRYGCAIHVECP
jgi:hypothetical protein